MKVVRNEKQRRIRLWFDFFWFYRFCQQQWVY